MSDPKIKISNSHSGAALGLFLFLSVWLVFGRGCENRPSSFEHWLKAKYQYRASDANWDPPAEPQPEPQPPAAEVADETDFEPTIDTDDTEPNPSPPGS